MNYMIDEYKALREEIMTAKERRLKTTSMTVGAFGVLLSIIANAVLGNGTCTPQMQLAFSIGGGIALFGILIPSQIMNISLQQSIHRFGDYILTYLEPKLPGLNWERRWHSHKSRYGLTPGVRGIGPIYYFLAMLPLLLPIYTLWTNHLSWLWILILTPFWVWSIILCIDMQCAKSRGWKWNWQPD